jgi:hypothetical protein
MSSPRPETTVRSGNPIEQPKRTQLSAVQVSASALAAVSSAVVASFFGLAGTLIGAALASVIATVSTTLYTESLRKTNERLKRVLIVRETAPATLEKEPAAPRTLPRYLDPRQAPVKPRGPRWSRVAVYAVAVFVVAMGIVSGVEFIGQKPVSALVGNSHSSGTTTIGELANVASHQDGSPAAPSSPATTTAENSPSTATPTGGGGSQSASPSPTTSSSGSSSSSAPRSTDTATRSTSTTSAPAQGTAPTP